jgi:hypothetical protein
LIPKKIETRIFPADFCTWKLFLHDALLCRHCSDCCFVFGS